MKKRMFSLLLAIVISVTVVCCTGCDETPQGESYTATEIYEMTKNSIGEITTYDRRGDELALGTGFVYETNGKIITNYHVIEESCSASIALNGTTYTVQSVLAYDKEIDLAILKVNASLSPLSISYDEPTVGETAYAFGSSRGLTGTFSQGIVTCANRTLDGVSYVQHDAAISGGNSGGPLINGKGKVIGVNTLTIKDSQNLNLAIATGEIKSLTFGTEMTLEEVYEEEFGAIDPLLSLKAFIANNGTYDSGDYEYELNLGRTYSNDYTTTYLRVAYYDIADDEITLGLMLFSDSLNAYTSFTVDAIDGIYSWMFVETNYSEYAYGSFYATLFDDNYILPSSSSNISSSSSLLTTRRLATSMLRYFLIYFDEDFASSGVTASDLGFYYY